MPSIKVLIIDDSETDRYTYRRYLEQASPDYEVHEAPDRAAGLALAESLNPDCVLLDLRLKEESGREQSGYAVLRELIGEKRPPKRPVIMMSVLTWPGLQHGAKSLGASQYLAKGKITVASLDQAVREALQRRALPAMPAG